MSRSEFDVIAAVAMTIWFAEIAAAQGRSGAAAEVAVGRAGFVDDATIGHNVFGGAARWYLLPRVLVPR